MKPANKLFVVRKYVLARDVPEAIRLERKEKVHDCFIDDDWKKANVEEKQSAIGFMIPDTEDTTEQSRRKGRKSKSQK